MNQETDVMDDATTERPAWARRIYAERTARKWSQADFAKALRTHAGSPGPNGEDGVELPSDEAVKRRIIDWEKGRHHPDPFHQELIARTFGTVTRAFFPPDLTRATSDDLGVGVGVDLVVLGCGRGDLVTKNWLAR